MPGVILPASSSQSSGETDEKKEFSSKVLYQLWEKKQRKELLATHSNFLVWEISWTEEPGGLQSMGLQGVGQD